MHQTIEELIKLLRETDMPMSQLARKIDTSDRWLYQLRDRRIKNPGIVSLQKVATHFGKTIELK